jgi:hypothetical protein
MENLEKSYGRTMDANLSDGKSVHGLWKKNQEKRWDF